MSRQSWTEEYQLKKLNEFIQTQEIDKKTLFNNPDGWYKVNPDHFKKKNIGGLIDKYKNSIITLLGKFGHILHKNHKFYEWKFTRVSNWEVPSPLSDKYPKFSRVNTIKYNLFKEKIISGNEIKEGDIPLFRRFIDYILEKENLKDVHDMHDSYIKKHGGTGLISSYGFLPLLKIAYPEKTILEFCIPNIQLTPEYWTPENIRKAFEYYSEKYNISINKLITLTNVDIEKIGWWRLSKEGTILELLRRGFPDINWDPLRVSKIYWTEELKINAFNKIKTSEKWNSHEDYYKLTIEICKKYDLLKLINLYNHSPITLLKELFPDYEWKKWRFAKSNNCWSDGNKLDIDTCRDYFDYFYTENDFKTHDDFADYIVKDFPAGIMVHFNFNLYKCMKTVYPEHHWEEDKFQAVNYSKTSIKIWNDLMKKISILKLRHALNGGEVKIDNYSVDAYQSLKSYDDVLTILRMLPSYCIIKQHNDSTIIIFEYHGSYWHAHPDYYLSEHIHPSKKIKCGEIYEATCKRTEELSKKYNVVEIWEHHYITYLKQTYI